MVWQGTVAGFRKVPSSRGRPSRGGGGRALLLCVVSLSPPRPPACRRGPPEGLLLRTQGRPSPGPARPGPRLDRAGGSQGSGRLNEVSEVASSRGDIKAKWRGRKGSVCRGQGDEVRGPCASVGSGGRRQGGCACQEWAGGGRRRARSWGGDCGRGALWEGRGQNRGRAACQEPPQMWKPLEGRSDSRGSRRGEHGRIGSLEACSSDITWQDNLGQPLPTELSPRRWGRGWGLRLQPRE